jgi:hypothetical protein
MLERDVTEGWARANKLFRNLVAITSTISRKGQNQIEVEGLNTVEVRHSFLDF